MSSNWSLACGIVAALLLFLELALWIVIPFVAFFRYAMSNDFRRGKRLKQDNYIPSKSLKIFVIIFYSTLQFIGIACTIIGTVLYGLFQLISVAELGLCWGFQIYNIIWFWTMIYFTLTWNKMTDDEREEVDICCDNV
jgi:hypothetical protein